MKLKLHNKKGVMGLPDTMVAIAIGLILSTSLIIGISGTLKGAAIQRTESDLRLYASDLQSIISEVGLFGSKDKISGPTEYQKYMEIFKQNYAHTDLIVDGIVEYSAIESMNADERLEIEQKNLIVTDTGFYVTSLALDNWKTPYRIIYSESDTVGRTFTIVSAGPNRRFDTGMLNDMPNESLEKYDDIIGLIKLKSNSPGLEATFDKFM